MNFPQLQSVTSKFELSSLPYVVRHVSKDQHVVHLQNFVTEESNTARRFFEALIKSNRSKLRAYHDEEEVPGIGEALRNIYAQNVINVAYFLNKNSIGFTPDAITTPSKPTTDYPNYYTSKLSRDNSTYTHFIEMQKNIMILSIVLWQQ